MNCQNVAPSQQPLSSSQKLGLQLVSLFQGREVVLAVDLTNSVQLNDEGRLRLGQIIKDSLNKGDTVYVVPFATTVNPLNPGADFISSATGIPFNGKQEDVDRILKVLPLKADDRLQNTDIQNAEYKIYEKLAQLNQCRMDQGKKIKPQSVVWLTDAPLNTPAGIPSATWVETPFNSPFRQANSPESLSRQAWMKALPLQLRDQSIDNYKLSVVDIPPTVQEFCTPAPGGRATCLVDAYILKQLWLPGLLTILVLAAAVGLATWGIRYWLSINRVWRLLIESEYDSEPQKKLMANLKRLGIGSDIDCPGDVRGYLKREGNQLFLDPLADEGLPIYYRNQPILKRQLLKGTVIRLNCPYRAKDYEMTIKIKS